VARSERSVTKKKKGITGIVSAAVDHLKKQRRKTKYD
jgi:hypothetical protein